MSPINAKEFFERLDQGEILELLDVRDELEYHTYNIGGKNIPLSKLTENIGSLGYNKTSEIIVICKAGLRSETARLLLEKNGFSQVRNLTGGLMALQRIRGL